MPSGHSQGYLICGAGLAAHSPRSQWKDQESREVEGNLLREVKSAAQYGVLAAAWALLSRWLPLFEAR